MTTEPQTIEISGAQALIYRDAPSWDGQRCAAIGNIEFISTVAGKDLLERIATELKIEGFFGLVGPMNGDTWHSYRVVSESDGTPPFMMEPVSGPHDLSAFEAAGFLPMSHYVSTRADLADTLGVRPVDLPEISVSAWDGLNAEELIRALFKMSGTAFASNKFFKPIDFNAFLQLYRPLLDMVDPRHVLFAHHAGGQLIGFLFGMPDRPVDGSKPAAILKTYASGMRGVGHLLADAYHRRAINMGFSEVIHALMHEDNVSLMRSRQHKARIFRRYALMGRKL